MNNRETTKRLWCSQVMIYFSKDISFLIDWPRLLIRMSCSLSNNLIATLSPVFLFSASRTLNYRESYILVSQFQIIKWATKRGKFFYHKCMYWNVEIEKENL